MSSGFVSSSEIAEDKKKVQEEWERVRKPEDPLLAPEPEVCDKSLFEQLKMNKDKKQAEIDEAKSYKNLVRGIDEDESEFLAEVNQAKHNEYVRKAQEEKEMLKEMAVAQVKNTAERPQLSTLKPSTSTTPQKSKQATLLGSIVKRKAEPKEEPAAKQSKQETTTTGPAMKVIAGIPGIADYVASSDSGSGSSSSDDEFSDSESSDSSDDDAPTISMLKKSQKAKKEAC